MNNDRTGIGTMLGHILDEIEDNTFVTIQGIVRQGCDYRISIDLASRKSNIKKFTDLLKDLGYRITMAATETETCIYFLIR